MNVCILDPGIGTHEGAPSSNLGDLIIQSAARTEIGRLFPDARIIRFSTHQPLSGAQMKELAACAFVFIGGTNLLSSNMFDIQFNNPAGAGRIWRQWKISLYNALRLKEVILLGVGWWQYQRPPGPFTRLFLRSVLSRKHLHSVRDGYTETMLRSIGIDNLINTACPTMWPIHDMDMAEYPVAKSPNVLVMITDYNKAFETDRELFRILGDKYENIYLWPQGSFDQEYVADLGVTARLLDRGMGALERFADSGIPFDYIGTRLHGGIWCLRKNRRALILAVDNRATEIGKDTGLPVVGRADFSAISQWIDKSPTPKIVLPLEAIARWKSQFQRASALIAAPASK